MQFDLKRTKRDETSYPFAPGARVACSTRDDTKASAANVIDPDVTEFS